MAEPAPPSVSVWRNTDFLLVWGGGFVNNIGDWLLAVALPVFVFTESGSGRATAAVFVIELLVGVTLGPYGGSLADRWNLRRTLVATNVLQAVTLLPLLWVDADRIWPAFVVTAVQAAIKQVNDPASFALVPRVVTTDQLVRANALESTGWSLARLVGSPLGGIAVAAGGLNLVVAVDAATFLAVAGAMMLVRAPTDSLVAHADPDGEGEDGSVRAAIREIRRRPVLTWLVVVQAVAQLAYAMFPVLFVVFVVDELGGDGADVGIVRGMAAFGGLIASAVVARFAGRMPATTLMAWGFAGMTVVAVAFTNAPAVTTAMWVYLVLFGLSGLPNYTIQIGGRSASQQLCPAELRGRLSGVVSAAGAVASAIGAIGVGVFVDELGSRFLFNVQAACFGFAGVVTLVAIVRRATPITDAINVAEPA